MLRFDCFYKNPHCHVRAPGDHSRNNMKDKAWKTRSAGLDQPKPRFPSMVKQAGYEEIAAKIDPQAIADQLTQLEPEILAKNKSTLSCSRESAQSRLDCRADVLTCFPDTGSRP